MYICLIFSYPIHEGCPHVGHPVLVLALHTARLLPGYPEVARPYC